MTREEKSMYRELSRRTGEPVSSLKSIGFQLIETPEPDAETAMGEGFDGAVLIGLASGRSPRAANTAVAI